MKKLLYILLLFSSICQAQTEDVIMKNRRSFTVKYTTCTGIGLEPGVLRRDVSDVFLWNGYYYCYYSKTDTVSNANYPLAYWSTVYGAKSLDGIAWTEFGEVIGKGTGTDDDRDGVYTPNVFIENDTIYLFYQYAVAPVNNDLAGNGSQEHIAVATSTNPESGFVKYSGNPIFSPPPKVGTSTLGTAFGTWDSYRTDGELFFKYNNQYFLYYKGRQRGLSTTQTRQGVAYSNSIYGPYTRSPENPIINSGHEPFAYTKNGKIYYHTSPLGYSSSDVTSLFESSDYIHFIRIAQNVGFNTGAQGYGPSVFRRDLSFPNETNSGCEWGLYHVEGTDPYLQRWDARFTNE